jgi:hypothetical protein
MFVAVVLENRVLRLVVYRKIDFRKVNQHRIELATLLAKLVKPLRHGGTTPTRTRAANNDMQVKRYHPIICLSAQAAHAGKKAKHMALDTPSGFPLPANSMDDRIRSRCWPVASETKHEQIADRIATTW